MSDNEPYTRIPNAILDRMDELGNAELRMLLAIVRRTAGWQKECDVISLTQLEQMTGIARPHVITALNGLLERGWVAREKAKRNGFCYRLVTLSNQLPKGTSNSTLPELVTLSNQSEPQLVTLSNTQKKDSKERIKKESVARTPKQGSLDFMHEACQMAQAKIGKKPAPAGAARIAATVTDMELWDVVTTKWAERYGTMNVDGLIDWYQHPEKMERRNGGIRQNTNNGRHPDPRAEWAGFTEADYDKPF